MATPPPDRSVPEPPAPETAAPNRWLLYLFFRPTRFFRSYIGLHAVGLSVFACYVFGLASAIERVDDRMFRAELRGASTFSRIADSWPAYWVACLVAGVFSAVFVWWLGSWWYRVRLRWSGAASADRSNAREVYVFASLVWAIPGILAAVWQTASYASPREAAAGGDLVWIVLVVFLFWSIVTSFRGATAVFPVRRVAALTWFLIIPTAFYAVVLGGVFALFSSGLVHARPDVERPRAIDRAGFSLRHPGNWRVDTGDPDYDPDGYFSISPPYADCAVSVHISRDFADAAEAVAVYRESLESEWAVTARWSSLPKWGRLAGDGVTGLLRPPGFGAFHVDLFAAVQGDRVLCVREICDQRVHRYMEPGLRLIRRSFRWR